jgi:hypothetical protein
VLYAAVQAYMNEETSVEDLTDTLMRLGSRWRRSKEITVPAPADEEEAHATPAQARASGMSSSSSSSLGLSLTGALPLERSSSTLSAIARVGSPSLVVPLPVPMTALLGLLDAATRRAPRLLRFQLHGEGMALGDESDSDAQDDVSTPRGSWRARVLDSLHMLAYDRDASLLQAIERFNTHRYGTELTAHMHACVISAWIPVHRLFSVHVRVWMCLYFRHVAHRTPWMWRRRHSHGTNSWTRSPSSCAERCVHTTNLAACPHTILRLVQRVTLDPLLPPERCDVNVSCIFL